VKIADLVQGVGQVLPGVPFESVYPAAISALREFCERTDYYRKEITPTLVDGQAEYTLTTPTNTELVRVMAAWQDGSYLGTTGKPISAAIAAEIQLEYYASSLVDLGLVPPPSEASTTITVLTSLQPTITAATIDDLLGKQRKGITFGTLALLFGQPLSGWYNPQQANFYQIKFEDKIRKASNDVSQWFNTRFNSCGMGTLV